MKCAKCGKEMDVEQKFCAFCGFVPVQSQDGQKPAPKKASRLALAALGIVAVAGGAFGIMKLTEKDPKEVVLDAFKTVYVEEEARPLEELFGWSELMEKAGKERAEAGLELVLEESSDEFFQEYEGAGLRLEEQADPENQKAYFNLGLMYHHMELVNLNLSCEDEMVRMAIPELSSRAFTMDVGEGIARRVKESPLIGPMLEEEGLDIQALEALMAELKRQAAEGKGEGNDLKNLYQRYRTGSQALADLKAALTVEKGKKEKFQIDGKSVNCRGYEVLINKDAWISFLRNSAEFFLQDEGLREYYLRDLQMGLRMTEIAGEAVGMESPEELLKKRYDEAEAQVEDAIAQMEKSLQDVSLTVYVDKDGRLAAIKGTTAINQEEGEPVSVAFSAELQGGAYRTQNGVLSVTLEDSQRQSTINYRKNGTYDGNLLTSSHDFQIQGSGDKVQVLFDGEYISDIGDYHMELQVTEGDADVLALSASGVVTEIDPGNSIGVDLDQFQVTSGEGENAMDITFSGEYYYHPYDGEISQVEGTEFDVLAADEAAWTEVILEAYFSVAKLMEQMGLSMQ